MLKLFGGFFNLRFLRYNNVMCVFISGYAVVFSFENINNIEKTINDNRNTKLRATSYCYVLIFDFLSLNI